MVGESCSREVSGKWLVVYGVGAIKAVKLSPGGKRLEKWLPKFSLWKSEFSKSAKGFALKL